MDLVFLETPNAIRRRKVLMYLLTPMVGARSSLMAVVLWERYFGSNETLLASVVEYSKLLCSKFDIPMEPLLFSNKLIHALLKPPKQLQDIHDPVGMGRILLSRELTVLDDSTTSKGSAFY